MTLVLTNGGTGNQFSNRIYVTRKSNNWNYDNCAHDHICNV